MMCAPAVRRFVPAHDSSRKLILIVEDDGDLRAMFRWILATSGFDVREAGDGYEALVLLEQHPPDLVVLDLGLPRVDGLSVQAEIAAQVVTRDIPVVIVTAARLDLTHLDVACVLRKPVDADELVATVQRCLVSRSPAAGASGARGVRDRAT